MGNPYTTSAVSIRKSPIASRRSPPAIRISPMTVSPSPPLPGTTGSQLCPSPHKGDRLSSYKVFFRAPQRTARNSQVPSACPSRHFPMDCYKSRYTHARERIHDDFAIYLFSTDSLGSTIFCSQIRLIDLKLKVPKPDSPCDLSTFSRRLASSLAFYEAMAWQNRASREPNPFRDRSEDSPFGSVRLTKRAGHGEGGTLTWIVRMVSGSQLRRKSFEKLRSAHSNTVWHSHCYCLPQIIVQWYRLSCSNSSITSLILSKFWRAPLT